jgi:acetoacetate decarboxylase
MIPDHQAPSIPTIMPYYSRPPFRYRDCPILVVAFQTMANVLSRLVPEPLEPNPDDLMVLVIGRQQMDRLGPYHEAILGVPCTLGEQTGNYVVVVYLDQTRPIVAGREIYGWPKKDADFVLHADATRASARAVRNGVEIIRADVEIAREAAPGDLALDPTWFNLKLIPSVTDGAPPDVMQLTATTLANVSVREAGAGPARLGLADSIVDPLASLMPVRDVVGGVFLRLSFDLLDGVVVHDYLRSDVSTREAPQPVGAVS